MSVRASLPKDTPAQEKDELLFLYNCTQINKVLFLEKSLRTHLQLLSNPSERIDIRFIFDDVRAKLEDQIIQSLADICYFLSDPEIIEKYKIQLKVARRYGFDGHGLPRRLSH